MSTNNAEQQSAIVSQPQPGGIPPQTAADPQAYPPGSTPLPLGILAQ